MSKKAGLVAVLKRLAELEKRPRKIRNSYQPELPYRNPTLLADLHDNAVRLLELILEDGTGSLKENVRVWPIRASYYRAGRKIVRQVREIEKEY